MRNTAACPIRDALHPPGLLHLLHRSNTSLHRPLIASLWFVTNLSLRFFTVDCGGGGAIISGLGNSGTFTRTVPLSMQMNWITESMLFSSCMSVDQGTEDSGTPVFSHSVHCIASAVFTDDPRKHCGRCSGCSTLGLCRSLPKFATQLRSHGWVVCTLVAHISCSSLVSVTCVVCACARLWLSLPRPPDLSPPV